jgi:transcriptional regulator PpsR
MKNLQMRQPDLLVTLDFSGVIQDVTASNDLADQDFHDWVGRRWDETCDAVGARKVASMLGCAREGKVCGHSQINQTLPNGGSLLCEYVAVLRHDVPDQITAIGKNLSAVVSVQNKLLETQRNMEHEYWQLRDLETRYRTLVNATADAVLMLRESDLIVMDGNEQGHRLIGLKMGDSLTDLEISANDSGKLRQALDAAKRFGKAPVTLVRVGTKNDTWMVRASSFEGNGALQYILHFTHYGSLRQTDNIQPITGITFGDIIAHLPDGMAAVNAQDIITHANPAFAALVDGSASDGILGKSIGQWLNQPGGDVEALRSKMSGIDTIRNFPSRVGKAGAYHEVLLSARKIQHEHQEVMLMLFRPIAA